jgi:hypothetical protein
MPEDEDRARAVGAEHLGPTRIDSLEIGENLRFSRWEWRVQLAASLLMLLVVIAAAVGVFGTGPLSDTSAEAGGLRVEYPRFVRYRGPHVITLHVSSQAVPGNLIEVWFERSFLQEMRVEELSPQPKDVKVGPDRVIYSFQAGEQAPPATIVFWLQPERIGPLGGEIGVQGGPQVDVNQFVYP